MPEAATTWRQVPGPPSAARLRDLLRADLGFHGSSGKFATHAWHPFPAKFPPQLAHYFIEGLSAPGATVLDPMCGSGTTLVEAQRLGRRAVGCDIDPLARLICEAKLSPVATREGMAAGRAVLDGARRDLSKWRRILEAELRDRFDTESRRFLDYWFPARQQLELMSLMRRIEAVATEPMRRFLRMVFSGTIIAKSGGVSWARDLAHTRPHRVLDKTPPSAFDAFEKRLDANLAVDLPPPLGAAANVLASNADATGLPSDSVDLIVTSPPYANNAIDYMRAHKFSLVWFGWKLTDLRALRKACLGHDGLAPDAAGPLPGRCETTLARLAARDARKAAVLRRYFGEVAGVLAEMHRVLRHGGAAVVVVGSSTLRGIDVETHHAFVAIAEREGFECAGLGVRQLDRDKRMMPARWGQGKRTGIEGRMHDEHVIGLIKP